MNAYRPLVKWWDRFDPSKTYKVTKAYIIGPNTDASAYYSSSSFVIDWNKIYLMFVGLSRHWGFVVGEIHRQ